MKLLIALAGLLVWAAPLLAETYSWVDENGTYNFTEDYARVPKKYRKSVGTQGNMSAEPVVTPKTDSKVLSPVTATDGKSELPVENSGGKSMLQWKQEFSEREAAMLAVRKRVDEIDALLKGSQSDKELAQSLIPERNKAVEQFNELRKQYDQQVELARKAGISFELK